MFFSMWEWSKEHLDLSFSGNGRDCLYSHMMMIVTNLLMSSKLMVQSYCLLYVVQPRYHRHHRSIVSLSWLYEIHLCSESWTAAFPRPPLFLLSHISHILTQLSESLLSWTQGWIHSLWALLSNAFSQHPLLFLLPSSLIHSLTPSTSTALEIWDIWLPGINLFEINLISPTSTAHWQMILLHKQLNSNATNILFEIERLWLDLFKHAIL